MRWRAMRFMRPLYRKAPLRVLCKVLAHNLCCMIQSMYELGVEPDVWGGNHA